MLEESSGKLGKSSEKCAPVSFILVVARTSGASVGLPAGRLAHAAASSAAGFAGLARVLDLTSHLQMYNEEALGESQCELSAVRARCSES